MRNFLSIHQLNELYERPNDMDRVPKASRLLGQSQLFNAQLAGLGLAFDKEHPAFGGYNREIRLAKGAKGPLRHATRQSNPPTPLAFVAYFALEELFLSGGALTLPTQLGCALSVPGEVAGYVGGVVLGGHSHGIN